MRFMHAIANQLRRPEGILGNLISPLMTLSNRQLNNWTIQLLDIQSTDHVIELGFGGGVNIRKIAAIAADGSVSGVDFSEVMLRKARRYNHAAISAGRVDLKQADVCSIPYPDESFDLLIAVQLIYFCRPLERFLPEWRRVIKRGGRIAVSFIPKEKLTNFKFATTGVFALYTGPDVVELVTGCGFSHVRLETTRTMQGIGACVTAKR